MILEADWAETKDASFKNPQVTQRLADQLQQWKSGLPKAPSENALSAARKKKKKAK